MSTVQSIKKISEIQDNMKLCDVCKTQLIDEYFDHFRLPKYEFHYKLHAEGKCEMAGCNRDAYCTMILGKYKI